MDQRRHTILSDREADTDLLDFVPYTNTLLEILRDPETPGPLTIGLFGTWGSGKTSLMRFVQKKLTEDTKQDTKPNFRLAWFDAWKYEKEEALWRALLLRVTDSLRNREGAEDKTPGPLKSEIERLEQGLYRDVEWQEKGGLTLDWSKLLKGAATGAVRLSLALVPGLAAMGEAVNAAQGKLGEGGGVQKLLDAFQRKVIDHRQAQLRSIEQFQVEFASLIERHFLKKGARLVVFVDDLDRCLPEKAIEILEAIKLFLDVEGCTFLLGLDENMIASGIKAKYRTLALREGELNELIDGAAYLEKIIQLPVRLPRIEPAHMRPFIKRLAVLPDERCEEVFAQGLETNPRKVKRGLNVFLFLWKLAAQRRIPVTPLRLAKIVVVYLSHPKLYEHLRMNPAKLRDLEDHFRKQLSEAEPRSDGEPPPTLDGLLPPALRTIMILFLDDDAASFLKAPYEEISSYFTLTRSAIGTGVAATLEATAKLIAERTTFPVSTFLPVPEGEFKIGTPDEHVALLLRMPETRDWPKEWKNKGPFLAEQPQHTVMLKEFHIAKYPVTNADYRAFVLETKHRPPAHWAGDNYPEELASHPVVNVSWRDAVAYCRWLTDKLRAMGQLGENDEVRLPTEAEWEKAARGTDGRLWPWGNDWGQDRCNAQESGIGTTTPVGRYSPAGDSPYGAVDMAGNVWEWCRTRWKGDYLPPVEDEWTRDYLEGDVPRVLRGGSWNRVRGCARAAFRDWNAPARTDAQFGFRCCLAKSVS